MMKHLTLACVAVVGVFSEVASASTAQIDLRPLQIGAQRQPSPYPRTWYVDVNAAPPGTGRPASPYASIQYAIAQPTTLDGDTVIVLPGTYFEHLDFAGKDIRVVSAGGPAATVVDAAGVGSVVSFQSGEAREAVLEGFTLQRGAGFGVMPEVRGGGVLCIGASPTLKNLVVRENQAKRGAGMYFEASSARVEQCFMEDNTAPEPYLSDNYGGGVYVKCGAPVVFDHCTMRRNRSMSAGIFGRGGGVYGGGTYLSCTIEDNVAYQSSGVDGGSCNPQLVDCVIKNNRNASGEATAYIAGGVYGPAVLTRCTIDGNSAWFFGGGAVNATLISCTISNNWVGMDGLTSQSSAGGGASACVLVDCDVFDNVAYAAGAFHSQGGGIATSTATRCRIYGNVARMGGGASNSALENCTVYGNEATDGFGGALVRSSAGTSNVRNSILYANFPNQIALVTGTANVTYSDVQGAFAGTGNIDADPMFVSEATHDFHLLLGSPCIDTGDPTTFDADGSRADMGAFPF